MGWQYLSHSDNHYVFLMFDKKLGRIICRSKVVSSGVDISTTLAEVQHRLSSTSKTGRRLLRVSSCWPPPLNASSTTVLHSLLSLTLAVEERHWGESQSNVYQFDRNRLYELCEPGKPEKREKNKRWHPCFGSDIPLNPTLSKRCCSLTNKFIPRHEFLFLVKPHFLTKHVLYCTELQCLVFLVLASAGHFLHIVRDWPRLG